MGRFHRRRKPRVQWFPTYGDGYETGGDNFVVSFRTTALELTEPNLTGLSLPLTIDDTQENLAANTLIEGDAFTLADIQNTSWRLRRIVGKIFVAYAPTNDFSSDDGTQQTYPAVLASAAFMVQKTNEVGADAVPLLAKNSLDGTSQQDPWIWRRSWMLGQNWSPNFTPQVSGVVKTFPYTDSFGGSNVWALSSFPQNNAGYGSVHDGPHVDTKIGRVIGPDDRLFINLNSANPTLATQVITADNSPAVYFVVDIRLLGTIMRSTNRRNASR